MYATTRSMPWYREPWPWILMAGPALVVVAAMVSLWLAVTTYDGLVSDDYYKEGTTINRTFERDDRARAMGLSGTLSLRPDGHRVELVLSATPGVSLPAHLRLVVAHPTRGGMDHAVTLDNVAPGRYVGTFEALSSAHWQFTLEDEVRSWRLVGHSTGVDLRLELRPAS
jgi:uncharacterized protein